MMEMLADSTKSALSALAITVFNAIQSLLYQINATNANLRHFSFEQTMLM
jgi:hypothetical protein